MTKRRITLYLDSALDKELQHAAIDEDLSFSDAIAAGAQLWLDSIQKKKKS